LHTGDYCHAALGSEAARRELARLEKAGRAVAGAGLRLAAGHGLDYANVGPVAALPFLEELNIGHSIISRAVLVGMERAVVDMRAAIAASARSTG
jgi:pyridoxine 5-phosphate synthase